MSQVFTDLTDPEVAPLLYRGKLGVIKTDTIYGLVAGALNEEAVERVYKVRRRDKNKPSIVLISDTSQIYDLPGSNIFKDYWPGKVSIVLPAPSAPAYLTRGGKTLAYRIPTVARLIELIEKTGPLIAPSANLQGKPPAKNAQEARDYFGDEVDFYVDEGEVIDNTPSRVLKFNQNGEKVWLR